MSRDLSEAQNFTLGTIGKRPPEAPSKLKHRLQGSPFDYISSPFSPALLSLFLSLPPG